MPDTKSSGINDTEETALEGISVSPPVPDEEDTAATAPHEKAAGREVVDEKLDKALEESFPGSDAPATTHPGDDGEPAPSSGYDPDKEPG